MRVKVAHFHTYAYRYANGVPPAEGADALQVNWCEVTVTDHKGQVVYRNGFVTDFKITDQNVAAPGRRGPRPVENRKREQQHAQDQGLSPRTQLRPR